VPWRSDLGWQASRTFAWRFPPYLAGLISSYGDVLLTGQYEPAAHFDAFKLQSAGLEDGFLALLHVPGPGC
jgi:hypothetical protein